MGHTRRPRHGSAALHRLNSLLAQARGLSPAGGSPWGCSRARPAVGPFDLGAGRLVWKEPAKSTSGSRGAERRGQDGGCCQQLVNRQKVTEALSTGLGTGFGHTGSPRHQGCSQGGPGRTHGHPGRMWEAGAQPRTQNMKSSRSREGSATLTHLVQLCRVRPRPAPQQQDLGACWVLTAGCPPCPLHPTLTSLPPQAAGLKSHKGRAWARTCHSPRVRPGARGFAGKTPGYFGALDRAQGWCWADPTAGDTPLILSAPRCHGHKTAEVSLAAGRAHADSRAANGMLPSPATPLLPAQSPGARRALLPAEGSRGGPKTPHSSGAQRQEHAAHRALETQSCSWPRWHPSCHLARSSVSRKGREK